MGGASPAQSALLSIEQLERSQKLVRGSGEVADSSTARIVNGVDNRGACAANAEFADALAAERATIRIVLVQKDDVDLANVCVDGDVVARQIWLMEEL